ncbi:PEP-CTERM sorting domain-containing protein [Algisphaera agarilytica]|uniref:Ice-binding protein C-terminal domain-containing protein n=1 Tax=Algisphaera agarilytica TaxID=1385975 RepID=A0A7X0H9G1_9BACT|nr:PEP-CTERM sorting domain-containing protein [Algisphaera agarilytica]MBB6431557.1 hypothetical protein [Algisphaera agarilytica]
MKSKRIRKAMTLALGLSASAASAQITDLTTWSLVEDPSHPLMNGSVTTGAATLTAGNGVIPIATDIGYASVNGQDVATSTSGFYFDPGSDFVAAVDYDLSFASSPMPSGGLAVGFGVGEDIDGTDSAGFTALIQKSGTSTFGSLVTAARTDDNPAGGTILSFTPIATGSMFVAYVASTGSITASFSATPGTNTPGSGAAASTFIGLQNNWDNQGLLLSFFLRSQNLSGQPAWTAGDATAVFSNLRVLSGTPIEVPEPTTAMLLVAAGAGLLRRRRG